MASGALPPALPPVKIEGEYYWDGGIVSNTPLQYLLDQDAVGILARLPGRPVQRARRAAARRCRDVLARQKDIMYSSRTRQNTDTFARVHDLKMRLLERFEAHPAGQADGGREGADRGDMRNPATVNIVHLIYQQKDYEGHAKDYEFSGTSMREHWDSGYEDTLRTLRHPEWLRRSSIARKGCYAARPAPRRPDLSIRASAIR